MMKTFITDNFLLKNKTAERLYHDYAKDMPIIDYHCHLSPQEIANDKRYRNITEAWLEKDHYKWRAIRTAGYKESEITGNIGNHSYDKERFDMWANVIQETIGNPLYHWTHLELLRYFNIDTLLTTKTSDYIYEKTNEIISQDDFSTKSLIKKFNVKFIGTTDDPIDTLEYHKTITDSSFECKVAPSWRPDKIINIDMQAFRSYIEKLGNVSNVNIANLDDLFASIKVRIEHFKNHGCTISDHALDQFVFTKDYTESRVADIFKKALEGKALTNDEIIEYKSYVLVELGKMYAENNWVMQIHIGVIRNNNTKMFNLMGPDTGFDSICNRSYARELSSFLDTLNMNDSLPKTILYSLNPSDNEVIGTMIGNFQGGTSSKLQFGSGWWFNDQKDGMERQIIALANLGLLSRFIGMLTDSRSFLSFSRHEYFRRILCNIIGTWVEDGEVANDIDFLGNIVKNISYNNAKKYFNL